MGMESSVAPFQKMSFETTTSFLRSATLYVLDPCTKPATRGLTAGNGKLGGGLGRSRTHRLGSTDYLDSPSSRIVLGKPVLGGTGSFDILADLGDASAGPIEA